MHSLWSRLTQVTSTFSTVVAVLAVVLSAVGWAQLQLNSVASLPVKISNVETKLSLRNTRRSGSVNGAPKENVRISFDLEADLSPLFNWNTKQVFVYLAAEYGGARDDIANKVSFWDKIITPQDNHVLKLKNERGKYNVWDVQDSFEGRNASLTLHWDVQPHIGFLTHGQSDLSEGTTFIQFPTEETKPKPKAKRAPKAKAQA